MGLRAVGNPAAGGQPGSFTTLTVSGAATIGGGLAVTGNLALEAGGVISSLSSDGSTQTAVSQTNAGTTDLVSYKGVGGGSFRFISGDAGGNTVVGSWTTGLLAVTGSISATGQVEGATLRVNVTPTAETPSATHTAVFNINGTNYKFLCLAA